MMDIAGERESGFSKGNENMVFTRNRILSFAGVGRSTGVWHGQCEDEKLRRSIPCDRINRDLAIACKDSIE